MLIYDLLYGIVGPNAYSDGVKINNKGMVAQQQAEDQVSDISIITLGPKFKKIPKNRTYKKK